MLSYIGGLFGLIAAACGLLMSYYSQCSYELSLSESIFEYDEQQDENQNGSDNDNPGANDADLTGNTIKKEPVKKKEKKAKSDQPDPSNFNFFDYLGYLVFIALKTVGFKPKWKKMIMYDDTIDEMRNQMDINTLLQKVAFYDKAIHALFD